MNQFYYTTDDTDDNVVCIFGQVVYVSHCVIMTMFYIVLLLLFFSCAKVRLCVNLLVFALLTVIQCTIWRLKLAFLNTANSTWKSSYFRQICIF